MRGQVSHTVGEDEGPSGISDNVAYLDLALRSKDKFRVTGNTSGM